MKYFLTENGKIVVENNETYSIHNLNGDFLKILSKGCLDYLIAYNNTEEISFVNEPDFELPTLWKHVYSTFEEVESGKLETRYYKRKKHRSKVEETLYLKVWHGNQIDQLSGEIITCKGEKSTVVGAENIERYDTEEGGVHSLDIIGTTTIDSNIFVLKKIDLSSLNTENLKEIDVLIR